MVLTVRCNVTGVSRFSTFQGTMQDARLMLQKATTAIAIRLNETRSTLMQPIEISSNIVLIDGNGATLDALIGAYSAFNVSGGAKLCITSLVLDSQGTGRALVAQDSGTEVIFEDVTFQRCWGDTVRALCIH